MQITALVSYFETLCIQHKQILHTPSKKHFFSDLNELINGGRGLINLPFVVIGPPSFEPIDDNKDNTQERNTVSLFILTSLKSKGETEALKLAAYDECKGIAIDFISRIQFDCDEQNLAFIDFNRSVIEPAGPILDNFHGVSLDLEFTDADIDLGYKPAKWNS